MRGLVLVGSMLMAGCGKPEPTPTATPGDRSHEPAGATGARAAGPKEKGKAEKGSERVKAIEPDRPPHAADGRVVLTGTVTGYTPVIEDDLAALAGKPTSGRVIVTLKYLAGGEGSPREAFCFFRDKKHHTDFLRAADRGERLTIRGTLTPQGDGVVKLDDCELLAP